MHKKTVLVLVGSYLPGYKAGGPIRSIENLVRALGEEIQFRIVTLDRDLGDKGPYPGILRNQWVRVGHADVMYLRPGWRGLINTLWLLCSVDPTTVVYLNTYFSPRFSMLAVIMRRLGLCRPRQIVLAPRGEFAPGALSLKKRKKLIYIALSRWFGLHRGILWQASSELEAVDIDRNNPKQPNIEVAGVISGSIGNGVSQEVGSPLGGRRSKKAGELRVVFVSRISPIKNLLSALRMLGDLSGNVSFDIYGPLEDPGYWSECERLISTLPSNVRAHYRGRIEHRKVTDLFAEHDLFLFPTLGENYGHVICESLTAGCPVLISDQTPWRDLEKHGAGWAVPLAETERFRYLLQQCVEADGESYAALSGNAKQYANSVTSAPGIIDANRRLFHHALTSPRK
jgi:glycosyltransferase involved in cell wall biosynthesis